MPRKKESTPITEWVSASEATQILSRNSGHEIVSSYIRGLARSGRVESIEMGGRTKLYKRAQVEQITVVGRSGAEERAAREKDIIARHLQGQTIREISKACGVSREPVRRVIKQYEQAQQKEAETAP